MAKEKDENREVRPRAEPVPKDQDFVDWLDELFYGDEQSPEKLEVRILNGKDSERFGPYIKQIVYAPEAATDAAVKAGVGSRKPKKEDLVKLANELLHRMQKDCDESRKPHVYGVLAWHFSRDDHPYQRYLKRLTPQGIYSAKRGADTGGYSDDDELSMAEKYQTAALSRDERMFQLLGASLEGLIDRQDRALERYEQALEKSRLALERQSEITERAISLDEERKTRRAWHEVGQKAAGRALDTAIDLIPPFIAHVTGKKLLGSKTSPESVALKNFFKRTEDGGLLTQEQVNAAFGLWEDEPPHALIRPGVLTLEQGKLLYDVAECRVPAEELDKLMPGGPMEITMEQVMRLQSECGFDIQRQLLPLLALFESRRSKQNEPDKTETKK